MARTAKFLVALCRGIPILNRKWLEDSAVMNSFQPYDSYYLKDSAAEKKYGFKLRESLKSANENLLFKNIVIYITEGVKPDANTLRTIIQAAGGRIVTELDANINSEEKLIIISCDDDQKIWHEINEMSGLPIHSAEFILTGVLRQKVEFENHILLNK
ncbi:hypothetical protein O9G_005877 [Rozella allomycis CSF55]|uniref:BRCT domain-containing protein n=2 Tax=Rozella allomycis (strain CSF55) TaxID=988480 RepID=A0A075ARL1_ROZAC|nr:hypothetical protein O9G_005877 [Rozella allomycis CSF55]|eukprot:EPZ31361.1 hypothetical protein O9G_005877 [Rozella allomycis CSF55]